MTIDELMTISNTLKDNGYYGIALNQGQVVSKFNLQPEHLLG